MQRLNLYSAVKTQTHQITKHILHAITHIRTRIRYPYALPSDIGKALGLSLPDNLLYLALLESLSTIHHPQSLEKFMTRKRAENCFCGATRCEKFTLSTLCSYRFTEGWVEFELQFDEHDKLRRLYLIHKELRNQDRIEINLKTI